MLYMLPLSFLFILLANDFPICDDSAFQYLPSVIYAEGIYYAFWSDCRYPASIFAARILPEGTVMDTNGVLLFHGNTIHGVRVAFDGQNFLAVFRDSC
jgi:hypothetical protein